MENSEKNEQLYEYTVFIKRLIFLKGNRSITDFSVKCGIPYSTMQGYTKGKVSPSLENLVKIAKATGTHVAWLIGEDETMEDEKRYRGLTVERHTELGNWFKTICMDINAKFVELEHAYPAEGKLSRPYHHLYAAYREMLSARSAAEENLFVEHGRQSFDIYYGKVTENRHENEHQKPTNSNDLKERIDMLDELIRTLRENDNDEKKRAGNDC